MLHIVNLMASLQNWYAMTILNIKLRENKKIDIKGSQDKYNDLYLHLSSRMSLHWISKIEMFRISQNLEYPFNISISNKNVK